MNVFKSALAFALAGALTFATLPLAAGSGAGEPQKLDLKHKPGDPSRYQEWLDKRVHHEIAMMLSYGMFDSIAYTIDGARVELSGQVTQPSLRSEAEARVKKIEGVESVSNKIEVLPVSNVDDRLRLALYESIFSSSMLQRYLAPPVSPIHIIVKHGHVTLTGFVANQTDKNVAALMAGGVEGVFSVTNNLIVKPGI